MPTKVSRVNGKISYTIPDVLTDDNHPLTSDDLYNIINAIKQNLGETNVYKQIISGYGSPDNLIHRIEAHVDTEEDININNHIKDKDHPILSSDFNYIIKYMNNIITDLYGYDSAIGNLKYKLYSSPGNFTFVTPKNCNTVLLGICGGGSGMGQGLDGGESCFDQVVAQGGVGVYTRNALAFTSGYSVSLFEVINGYYGRPERSISWINTNSLSYNDIEYNSGQHGEFIHAIYNVKPNTGYKVKVGRAAPNSKYFADLGKMATNGFVYIAYLENEEPKYGFDTVFTKPGEFTYTVPDGVTDISVALIGGGAIYIDKTKYNKSGTMNIEGSDGEDTRFYTLSADGGKYKDDKGQYILKDITTSGHNLSFFNEYGTLGRGFINNTYGTKVSGDGEMVVKKLKVIPGQIINGHVGDGGSITLNENGVSYNLKANHGAVGIYIGDYENINAILQIKLTAANDTINKDIYNNIITNLEAVNKIMNDSDSFWDANGNCVRSCQVSCQSSCQLACQDCQYFTAHNQDSGGWI